MDLDTERGRPLPLGATPYHHGVNFVLPTRHGTAVSLVLSPADSNESIAEIQLDPFIHRTGNHWHIAVNGLPADFRYGWRVDGPKGQLHRYDPSIVLLDRLQHWYRVLAYGENREITMRGSRHAAACSHTRSTTTGPTTVRRWCHPKTQFCMNCTCAASLVTGMPG